MVFQMILLNKLFLIDFDRLIIIQESRYHFFVFKSEYSDQVYF